MDVLYKEGAPKHLWSIVVVQLTRDMLTHHSYKNSWKTRGMGGAVAALCTVLRGA